MVTSEDITCAHVDPQESEVATPFMSMTTGGKERGVVLPYQDVDKLSGPLESPNRNVWKHLISYVNIDFAMGVLSDPFNTDQSEKDLSSTDKRKLQLLDVHPLSSPAPRSLAGVS